ncbi:hypothetical protein KVR01_005621 [Diaporthe batatas]|uniref:uncharacterized protein n=1 Tax=Diaporthe batatas TaxID=748121 RepID=UPI001D0457D3|nr:uncharacterized protein KVR01_005621 [Diaporthe batatas]KAG8165346.1 hypothetical protein KVR01_005621 [Diaporthe batatas]
MSLSAIAIHDIVLLPTNSVRPSSPIPHPTSGLVLKSFGLDDIHCLIVEGADSSYCCGHGDRNGDEVGSADTAEPADDPRHIPVSYHIREEDYYEPWLHKREMLSLNSRPGSAISSTTGPSVSGTLGFTILLEVDIQPEGVTGTTQNNSSTHRIAKLFLTCRHVVDDSDSTSSSKYIDRLADVTRHGFDFTSLSAQDSLVDGTIDAIQLDQDQYESLLESARSEKKKIDFQVLKVYQDGRNVADLTDVQRRYRDRLMCSCSALNGFISHLERFRDPQSRRIGTVVLSPPLTGPTAENDWALILSRVSGPNLAGCSSGVSDPSYKSINDEIDPNLFWIDELSPRACDRFRNRNEQAVCTVTGDSRTGWFPPDFMKLKAYFREETIDRHCCTAINTIHGDVPDFTEEQLARHLGSPDSMDVYQVGATSSGEGKLSHVKSVTFKLSNGQAGPYEYCILGHSDKPFSKQGDSGSAIFGILPPLDPTDSSPTANADTEKDAQVGILGLVRGGGKLQLRGRYITSDVTYAIPIGTIMEEVEKRGRVLNWTSV